MHPAVADAHLDPRQPDLCPGRRHRHSAHAAAGEADGRGRPQGWPVHGGTGSAREPRAPIPRLLQQVWPPLCRRRLSCAPRLAAPPCLLALRCYEAVGCSGGPVRDERVLSACVPPAVCCRSKKSGCTGGLKDDSSSGDSSEETIKQTIRMRRRRLARGGGGGGEHAQESKPASRRRQQRGDSGAEHAHRLM